jgi:Tol biopolymer transport system component
MVFRLMVTILAGVYTLMTVGMATGYGLPHRGVLAFSTPINPIGEWHVLMMDVRTRRTIRLADYGWRLGVTLQWSPDGERLTYATYSPRSDVFVVDVYNRDVYNLTDDWADDRYPTWSPDSQYIAFFSNRERPTTARYDIYVAPAKGTGQPIQRMTFAEAAYPVWSPDGTQIVYTSRAEGDLFRINTGCAAHCSTLPTRLTTTYYEDRNPVWSPDGDYIAFITFLNAPGSTGDQIFVIDRDGGGLRLLAAGWRFQGVPSWSPDSQHIAFVGKASAERFDSIYIADVRGQSAPRKLAEDAHYAYNERWSMWSPDSRYIAYSHRRTGGLYIVEVATGIVEQLSHLTASYPVWQPSR